MAQIDIEKIEKIEKTRNYIHDKVYSTYTVFEENGKKYIQIDTYGKSERMLKGKISQSFQIDIDTAKFISELINKEFNL